MDRQVTVGLIALLMGLTLTWIGWRHWRFRKEDSISIMEASILSLTNEEPLPKTRFDRALTYFQAFAGLTLGPFLLLMGLIILLSELKLI